MTNQRERVMRMKKKTGDESGAGEDEDTRLLPLIDQHHTQYLSSIPEQNVGFVPRTTSAAIITCRIVDEQTRQIRFMHQRMINHHFLPLPARSMVCTRAALASRARWKAGAQALCRTAARRRPASPARRARRHLRAPVVLLHELHGRHPCLAVVPAHVQLLEADTVLFPNQSPSRALEAKLEHGAQIFMNPELQSRQ
jgi:hypothetical protein